MTQGMGHRERLGGGTERSEIYLLNKRIDSLVKIGVVDDYDMDMGKARVRIGNGDRKTLVTGWLNWASMKSSYDLTGDVPELGEQVVLLSPNGRMESAFILCSLRQMEHPHPSLDPNDKMTFYRVLEGTDYWTAMERRFAVGEVNPEQRAAHQASKSQTYPPQDRKITKSSDVAEVLEYYYINHIRPELLAVVESVATTTGNDSEARSLLAANVTNDGEAKLMVECAVGGAGNATSVDDTTVGSVLRPQPYNPKKAPITQGSGGNALKRRRVRVLGNGNATDETLVSSAGGDATQVVNIDASGQAKVQINLTGGSTIYEINIGGSQKIVADGTLLHVVSQQVLVEATFIKMVGDTLIDGNLDVTGEVNDSVRTMSADRVIYNKHVHPISSPFTKPTKDRQ